MISRAFCQNSDNFPRLKAREIIRTLTKQVELFPNFKRKPFDYLLISWVTNYAHNRNYFYWFILSKTENVKKNIVLVSSIRYR